MKSNESSVIVITSNYSGLGDHLFLSHLPRIAKEYGNYSKVYVSLDNKFRSKEIKELVWDKNPYVDGFAAQEQSLNRKIKPADGSNLLDLIMLAYDLDDGLRFHEPEIYCMPNFRAELADTVVYDPNYISFVGALSQAAINNIINNEPGNLVQLPIRVRGYPVPDVPTITSSSLLDYCSIIKSAKKFICLSSGSATLAAALRVPSWVFYGNGQNKIFHHSKMHTYIDVGDYTVYGNIKAIGLKLNNKFRNAFPGLKK